MIFSSVAVDAVQIGAVFRHVNVKIVVGIIKSIFEITTFEVRTSA